MEEDNDWVVETGEMSFSLQANSIAKLSNRNRFVDPMLLSDVIDFGVMAFSIFFVTIDALR